MEKEEITNPEQDDKFTTKDKIVGTLLIIIILLEIVILIITIKKDKENNYFEVKGVATTYAFTSSAHQGFPLKLKCSDTQKIDITLEKGTLFNKEETLSATKENSYTVTCEQDEIIYWIPDDSIEENETIKINFKSDNNKYPEQEIKIQKQENEYKLVE